MLSNQEVVDFVTQRIGQAMEPEDICEELMTRWVDLNLVQSKEKLTDFVDETLPLPGAFRQTARWAG